MKKKQMLRKKWKESRAKGGTLPLLGVALIVFVMTVAVFFAAGYVAESYSRDNMLTNWDYAFTEKAGEAPAGGLRVYNGQNPISACGGERTNNLYLSRSISPAESGTIIAVVTDFAPIKIRLNGREVYNNRFDEGEVAGNCYNAVAIPAQTREQQVEVLMKLPFSARFEAYLNGEGTPLFSPSFGFWFGCGIAAAGVLALLVTAVLCVIRRRAYRTLMTAGITACAGLMLTLYLLPEVTCLFTDPVWLKLTSLPVHLTFMGTLACLSGFFRDHGKSTVAIVFAAVLSAAAVTAAPTAALFRAASALMCVLCLAAALLTSRVAAVRLERRLQYAAPVFVLCAYYALTMLLAGIFLCARMRMLYGCAVIVPTLVVAFVLEYFYVTEYRFHRKNSELRAQTAHYGNTVDSVSLFIRSMMSCTDPARFYETATHEILRLLRQYDPGNREVRCCAAVKRAGGFEEKINRGAGECDYPIIEQNCLFNDKNCLFAETYFDFVLRDGDRVDVVFHFENIKNGLDVFFISVLAATYCGLATTYGNIAVNGRRSDINIIFEELAENAEIDNGCSVDHLRRISEHTYALCREMGMDKEKARHIALAAKLHDLGKIAVPKSVIHKKGRLSEDERVIVNSHTKFGYTILSAYDDDPLIATAAEIARYHHERWDGEGTNGLSGENIPLSARIVTVCDVYDALTSERSYKKAWSVKDALTYLSDNEGKIFDQKITECFIRHIMSKHAKA